MIFNASTLLGRNFTPVEESHIVVEDGSISEVDDGFSPDGIDLKDYIACPAFFNSHIHTGDSFAKDACWGMDVRRAVGKKGIKWVLYSKAKREEIISGMKNSLEEMLSCGTLGFCDFREQGSSGVMMLKEALEGSRLHVIILGRDVELNLCDGLGLNCYQLDQIPKNREGKLIAVHAGECPGEIARALDYGPDILVHATLADEGDIERIAEKKTPVVICPRANAALGVGIPPVQELVSQGITVCLGTDNVMINSPNILREMEFLSKTSCLRGDPPSPTEILRMATLNPAEAFGLKKGMIDKGRDADIIFIHKNAANMRDARDLASAIVSRAYPCNIHHMLIGGELITRTGSK